MIIDFFNQLQHKKRGRLIIISLLNLLSRVTDPGGFYLDPTFQKKNVSGSGSNLIEKKPGSGYNLREKKSCPDPTLEKKPDPIYT